MWEQLFNKWGAHEHVSSYIVCVWISFILLKIKNWKLKTIKKYFSDYYSQGKHCSLAFLHCSCPMNNARRTRLIKKKGMKRKTCLTQTQTQTKQTHRHIQAHKKHIVEWTIIWTYIEHMSMREVICFKLWNYAIFVNDWV